MFPKFEKKHVISCRGFYKKHLEEYAEQQKAVLSGRTISPGQQVFPLKLVLMSATLRIEHFINNRKLFRDPPPGYRCQCQTIYSIKFEMTTDEEKPYELQTL
ncbi:hypothetical protein GBA52_024183 [Prunus armeniaca]|nr:hypothetical protein GBA52_024183 [Prunus armeniaca]